MFTGLIEEIGVVSRRSGHDLAVMAKVVLDGMKTGDSVAIDGACMTVSALINDGFVVDVSPESLARTTLSGLKPGDAVNLERSMAVGERFGGHFVLGHVDGVGRVDSIQDQGRFSLWRFQAPVEVTRYIVPKGSITVNGISLTVVEPQGETFGVAVIPETLRRTTLGVKRRGDPVNLEADIIGKHVYHYMKGSQNKQNVTMDFLAEHGFL
jgi:riboflavin synthase